jgi:hypothetical protein
MQKTIIVDREYYDAAEFYKDAATSVHEATELFKKSIVKMIDNNSIVGHAAINMISFLTSMSTVLRAIFKEQITWEAVLCKEYVQKITEADTKMCFNPSGKDVQEMRPSDVAEVSQKEGQIIINKGAVDKCISQLKEGPIQRIQDNINLVRLIHLSKCEGIVKQQNMEVRAKTIESLNALLVFLNEFITAIESVTGAVIDADESIANAICAGK